MPFLLDHEGRRREETRPCSGHSLLPDNDLDLTVGFGDAATARTTGLSDMPWDGVGTGRSGPASDSNHIELPLGTGPP